MSNKVLTFLFDTAEADLDPIISAGINAIKKAGHVVKEVRVMSDKGEVKVALNQVKGVVADEADKVEAAVKDVVDPSVPVSTTSGGVDANVPVDTPVTAQAPVEAQVPADTDLTIDQKRDNLLAQLEALDAEEETNDGGTTGTSDPTSTTTVS